MLLLTGRIESASPKGKCRITHGQLWRRGRQFKVGNSINARTKFLVIDWIVFPIVKAANKMKDAPRRVALKEPEATKGSATEKRLIEIRDALRVCTWLQKLSHSTSTSGRAQIRAIAGESDPRSHRSEGPESALISDFCAREMAGDASG